MKEKVYPRSFSHIGITVPNIEKAVKFYEEVMGWYVIMQPSEVKKESQPTKMIVFSDGVDYICVSVYD